VSTADHILDQIDNALHDYDVSDDAMRSRPETEAQPDIGPRVWIAPADTGPDEGGWEELGHITSIDLEIGEFTIDPAAFTPAPSLGWEELREYIARVEAERARRALLILQALREGLSRLLVPAAQAAESFQHAPEAVDCDDCSKPTPPRDRPAWQSPYGPARRRR
jgi:hypothetical protein